MSDINEEINEVNMSEDTNRKYNEYSRLHRNYNENVVRDVMNGYMYYIKFLEGNIQNYKQHRRNLSREIDEISKIIKEKKIVRQCYINEINSNTTDEYSVKHYSEIVEKYNIEINHLEDLEKTKSRIKSFLFDLVDGYKELHDKLVSEYLTPP